MPNLANTQLGSGMNTARRSKLLSPEQVADAIVRCIERPRLEVPCRDLGFPAQAAADAPVRVRRRDHQGAAMDKIATEPDETQRRAYEAPRRAGRR
jgi:hypothetical protein